MQMRRKKSFLEVFFRADSKLLFGASTWNESSRISRVWTDQSFLVESVNPDVDRSMFHKSNNVLLPLIIFFLFSVSAFRLCFVQRLDPMCGIRALGFAPGTHFSFNEFNSSSRIRNRFCILLCRPIWELTVALRITRARLIWPLRPTDDVDDRGRRRCPR